MLRLVPMFSVVAVVVSSLTGAAHATRPRPAPKHPGPAGMPPKSQQCTSSIDSKDPAKGPVRAGDDYSCAPVPAPGSNTVGGCAALCCGDSRCQSFSFNDPWGLNTSYMGCTPGVPCCCLKSAVPPLEPNTWTFNITSGVAARTADPCTNGTTGLCCSLNGVLQRNLTCTCDSGWTGPDCGELDLVPAPNIDGAFQTKVNPADCATSCGPSSWGGLPVLDDSGTWHLFASLFVQNCTLSGWNPGSTVVRATSTSPMGPFRYAETVFGTFHHNPTVRKLTPAQAGGGASKYVMFMIGDNVSPPADSGAACGGNPMDVHHLEGYIKMAWADSVLGPWTSSRHTMVPPGSVDDWDAMVTNPSPLFLANGSAFLYFRGTQWPANGDERIGVAAAASWKGPYGRPFGNNDPLWDAADQAAFVEDPWVWEDARGNFHMLAHGHWDENGYLAFAEHPEGPWHFRHTPTYTNTITLTNGSKVTLKQRERPQLLFDDAGRPSILYTGVAPPWAKFYGYTYTHAQRIAGSTQKYTP